MLKNAFTDSPFKRFMFQVLLSQSTMFYNYRSQLAHDRNSLRFYRAQAGPVQTVCEFISNSDLLQISFHTSRTYLR